MQKEVTTVIDLNIKLIGRLVKEFTEDYMDGGIEDRELIMNFSRYCIDCIKGKDERAILLSIAGLLVTSSNFDSLFSIVHIVNRFYHEAISENEGMDR